MEDLGVKPAVIEEVVAVRSVRPPLESYNGNVMASSRANHNMLGNMFNVDDEQFTSASAILDNPSARALITENVDIFCRFVLMSDEQFVRGSTILNNDNSRAFLRERPEMLGYLLGISDAQFDRACNILDNPNARALVTERTQRLCDIVGMNGQQFQQWIQDHREPQQTVQQPVTRLGFAPAELLRRVFGQDPGGPGR